MTIGVSELQKNISIIRNLTESLQVVDKKTNEVLATILPAKKKRKKQNWVDELGGILGNNGVVIEDLDKAISEASAQAAVDRYLRSYETD